MATETVEPAKEAKIVQELREIHYYFPVLLLALHDLVKRTFSVLRRTELLTYGKASFIAPRASIA